MPQTSELPDHISEGRAVTYDDITHALAGLDPLLWGFKSTRPRRPPQKASSPPLVKEIHNSTNQSPLPPHRFAVNPTKATSTSPVTTAVVAKPLYAELPAINTAESELTSVDVPRTAALASATLPSPSDPFLSSPKRDSTPDHEKWKTEEVEKETIKAAATEADANRFPAQSFTPRDVSHGINSNSTLTSSCNNSSRSNGTADTRMKSVHPTDSTRPLAHTKPFHPNRCFVPTSFSFGVRPLKQCLWSAGSFSGFRHTSPSTFADSAPPDASFATKSKPQADSSAIKTVDVPLRAESPALLPVDKVVAVESGDEAPRAFAPTVVEEVGQSNVTAVLMASVPANASGVPSTLNESATPPLFTSSRTTLTDNTTVHTSIRDQQQHQKSEVVSQCFNISACPDELRSSVNAAAEASLRAEQTVLPATPSLLTTMNEPVVASCPPATSQPVTAVVPTGQVPPPLPVYLPRAVSIICAKETSVSYSVERNLNPTAASPLSLTPKGLCRAPALHRSEDTLVSTRSISPPLAQFPKESLMPVSPIASLPPSPASPISAVVKSTVVSKVAPVSPRSPFHSVETASSSTDVRLLQLPTQRVHIDEKSLLPRLTASETQTATPVAQPPLAGLQASPPPPAVSTVEPTTSPSFPVLVAVKSELEAELTKDKSFLAVSSSPTSTLSMKAVQTGTRTVLPSAADAPAPLTTHTLTAAAQNSRFIRLAVMTRFY